MRGTVLISCLVLLAPLFLVPAAAQNVLVAGVESNPAGRDEGNEWILLFNPGTQPVDLSGWRIVTEDGDVYTLYQTIPACEGLQVGFAAQFLDNKGAIITLFDSHGTKIDETPPISDGKNDDSIWSIATPRCGDGSSPPAPATPPAEPPALIVPWDILKVTFVDLGSAGESILLTTPDGTAMLIDGGLARSHDRLERIINDNGVDSIDVVVATHADQDHIEGLTSIIRNPDIAVKQMLLPHIDATTRTYANFASSIQSMQIPYEIAHAGHVISLADSLDARVISPPMQGISDSSSTRNTNSIVIHLEYGAVSFLFTGDATAKTERWIVSNMPELDIDIMSGPHHGSGNSSTARFIDHVTPRLVVFSADADNRYGHPHPDAISRYDTRQITHYQTGTDGPVVIRTDGVGCSVVLVGADPVPCYDGIDPVESAPPSPAGDGVPNHDMDDAMGTRNVPAWVKETAKLWHQGLITDQQFVAGIQYLIEHNIMLVHVQGDASSVQDEIPAWIRTSAELWVDGHISDDVFLQGIEFLMEHGIIRISIPP